jgi:hypothetical protein
MEQGRAAGAFPNLCALRSDTSLKQETAICSVEDNFARRGGTKTAGQNAVGIWDHKNGTMQDAGWSVSHRDGRASVSLHGSLPSGLIDRLGAIEDQGDLNRNMAGVENPSELV